MQLESAVEVGEVVETRKSRNFNDRAVGCQQQHSRSVESQVVDVADKGRIHQLLEEMRYVVAADSCRVGDIVERQAVDIVLVNVGSNALESTVLFAFALGIDDLDESVGKQLIKRLVHLAVNKELEKLEKEIGRLTKKLGNEGFLKKAPAQVVEGEREKLKGYEEKKTSIESRIQDLAKL